MTVTEDEQYPPGDSDQDQDQDQDQGDGGDGADVKRKRARQILSCLPCRNRKVKCDRRTPCERCVKQQQVADCVYETHVSRGAVAKRKSAPAKPTALERLRGLEKALGQLMQGSTPPGLAAGRPVETFPRASRLPAPGAAEATAAEGHLLLSGDEPTYVGSTHWSVILDSVRDLKSILESPGATPSSADGIFAPDGDMLLCGVRPPSLASVLVVLPPRLHVDRLVSTYFRSKYLASPMIHVHQFQRQYDHFWEDPFDTPVLWISLLMSILSIAAKSKEPLHVSPPTDAPSSTREDYLTAAAQCLMLGNYSRPKPFVVEALLIFCQAKSMLSPEPSREVAMTMSLVARLAFRCGYHRDPHHLKTLSVFDGEMRRRTWAVCKNLDVLVATQIGVPTNIPDDCHDTQPPSNIADADFDEDTAVLPASQPELEPTPILLLIIKDRFTDLASKVLRVSISSRPLSLDDLHALDAEIDRVHGSVPPCFRFKPLSASFADTTDIIMSRYICETVYHKARCLLHRRFLDLGGPRSRDVSADAAASVMHRLTDLILEFQPGGQLEHDLFMLSSTLIHDFLMAATVLAIAVSQDSTFAPDRRHAYLDTLKSGYQICRNLGQSSKEAQRVAKSLEVLLPDLQSASPDGPWTAAPSTTSFDGSSGATSMTGQVAAPADAYTPQMPVNRFDAANADVDEVNWSLLDHYLQFSNPSHGGQPLSVEMQGYPTGTDDDLSMDDAMWR